MVHVPPNPIADGILILMLQARPFRRLDLVRMNIIIHSNDCQAHLYRAGGATPVLERALIYTSLTAGWMGVVLEPSCGVCRRGPRFLLPAYPGKDAPLPDCQARIMLS